jgi:hypothetical protein
MEAAETKEEKLKKLLIEYLNNLKAGWYRRAHYRVQGGNTLNEVITEFKKNEQEVVSLVTNEFIKSSLKEELTDHELVHIKAIIVNELRSCFTKVEQEAYTQLRNEIRELYSPSWYEGGIKKRAVVPDSTIGNGIHLLTTDRPAFEKFIKIDFLKAEGPGRANKYGLTEENLPEIDQIIREESAKLLTLKNEVIK